MGKSAVIPKASIIRLTIDILASELSETRGRSALELGADGWGTQTRLDDEGLGLDSLERLNATSALNAYFHLHEYGAEDYLLAMPTIGDWADLIEQSLRETGHNLTFRTSGSTGQPKACQHRIADLEMEAGYWAQLLSATKHILSLVPSQHIYGTIWTVLLPKRLGVSCEYGRLKPSSALSRAVGGAPTLVIATPTIWQFLAKSLPIFPTNILGITSTGPLTADLGDLLLEKGLGRLVEVYGSSETGAVGWRDHGDAHYNLIDYWRPIGEGELARRNADGSENSMTVMDRLVFAGDTRFAVAGRLDGAVQIGGYNVFPGRIRDTLAERPEVRDAAVRLDQRTGRLKAFLVPHDPGCDPAAMVNAIDRWCAEALPAHERPRSFTVGNAIPRNEMGKISDWQANSDP
jgi:4-coumarate--CoA ligase (photoactive yellow protein activation family)